MIMFIPPALLIAGGVGVYRWSRLVGGGLVFVGGVGFAVMTWWTIITPILAALAVVLWAIAFRSPRAQQS